MTPDIVYYIFALFAIASAFHLYRNELLTGLGVNLSLEAYKKGTDSYDFVLTANPDKDSGVIQLGDGTAFADLNDKADIGAFPTSGRVLHLDASDPNSYPGTGTTWTDLSGEGNHATLNNVTFVDENGGLLRFNGTTSFGEVVDAPELNITGAVTVAAWVNIKSTDSFQVVATKGKTFGANADLDGSGYTLLASQGSPRAQFKDDGTELAVITSPYSGRSQWVFVVFTWDSTVLNNNMLVYINGFPVDNSSQTDVAVLNTRAENLFLGKDNIRNDFFTEMDLGSILIYNRALTHQEIWNAYMQTKDKFD